MHTVNVLGQHSVHAQLGSVTALPTRGAADLGSGPSGFWYRTLNIAPALLQEKGLDIASQGGAAEGQEYFRSCPRGVPRPAHPWLTQPPHCFNHCIVTRWTRHAF